MKYHYKSYEPGPFIERLQDLVEEVEREKWVIYRHRVISPAIIENMTLRDLGLGVKAKNFRYALKKIKKA